MNVAPLALKISKHQFVWYLVSKVWKRYFLPSELLCLVWASGALPEMNV